MGRGVVFYAVLVGAILSAGSVFAAADAAMNTRVEGFVNKAVDYARSNGKEKALAAFMDRKGEFVQGELYIYAYDFSGTVISHGGQPNLVGKNLIDMQDANGVKVIQQLVRIAQSGDGWLAYLWPNPVNNNKVESKFGYVKKVDDTWFLGSGYYESAVNKK